MTMHTPLADLLGGRNAVDLNRPSLSVGLQQRQQGALRSQPYTMSSRNTGADIERESRNYGLAEALADPIQVTSGGWGEALAEAVAGGIRGRTAMDARRQELEGEQRRREAYTNATRAAIDPAAPLEQRNQRVTESLLPEDPQAALQYFQSQQPTQEMREQEQERQRVEAIISQLPPDQQALARLNPEGFVNGMMRHRFPAPQRSAQTFDPSSDEWEAY